MHWVCGRKADWHRASPQRFSFSPASTQTCDKTLCRPSTLSTNCVSHQPLRLARPFTCGCLQNERSRRNRRQVTTFAEARQTPSVLQLLLWKEQDEISKGIKLGHRSESEGFPEQQHRPVAEGENCAGGKVRWGRGLGTSVAFAFVSFIDQIQQP